MIRRGDTLSRIAANHHVPIDAITALNDLPSVRRLKPGTELVIPEGGGSR
ncbi:M23 family peptidase, partial [Pseudomonas sp. FW305-20]